MKKEELIREIKAANITYSSGNPYMTDEAYDLLWHSLYLIDPNCPHLYHTGNASHLPGNHQLHKFPLMGTQKAFSTSELAPFLNRFNGIPLIIEPKYDGCAAMLYKQPNNKLSLILEGDGTSGRDISFQLTQTTVDLHPIRSANSVELIIPYSKWHPKLGKNPRNAIAGWINSPALMPAHYVSIVSHNDPMIWATFPSDLNTTELESYLFELYATWKTRYPLDGLMIKVAAPEKRILSGHNGSVYAWSIAWKPSIHFATSIVRSIEWNTSRTGRVVPTVLYEPIEIASTINSRATGNNAAWIKEHNIIPGAGITIVKSGDIIPKIIQVNHGGEASIPFKCPSCNEPISMIGKDLICSAPDCIVQLAKRVAYFYSDKGMNLKSIGETMIGELIAGAELVSFVLSRSPWALLDPEHYQLSEIIESIWGPARWMIYLDNLEEISGKKTIINFISALGLKGLAYKTAFKLFSIMVNKESKLLGNISRISIDNYIVALSHWQTLQDEKLSFSWREPNIDKSVQYCITGVLSVDRSDMVNYLQSFGWIELNQVSKHTDYLLLGTLSHESQKLHLARKNNIRIITENDLAKLLVKETVNDTEEL